jgi:hypothetical protein
VTISIEDKFQVWISTLYSTLKYLIGITRIRAYVIPTHTYIKTRKGQISESLAIIAMTLLLIHIVDGSIERISKHGFLPVSIDETWS